LRQHEQQQVRRPDATSPDGEFEQVRRSFQVRLRGEQARLESLAKELGAAELHSTSVLGDIEMFAHRLRGAAAVFSYPDLSSAAMTLELAAAAASVQGGQNGDASVWSTLRTLAEQLASMNRGELRLVAAVALPGGQTGKPAD
jgi:HPt (histidine-containing phosphotransfer) domain-containing protein